MTGTAIVTGATSGIGRAAAIELARRGWWVAASGRDAARGAEVDAELGDGGAFVAADLVHEEESQRLVDEVFERRGRLDVLVNNAAVYDRASLADLPTEQLDLILANDLRAPILLARAAIRRMIAGGGGTVINVSSEAGIVAIPGQVAYNVAKAGLIMLTRSIAVDHSSDGVRAVSVCPGTTRTPLVEAAIAAAPDSEAHERGLAEGRPARRLGRVEEVAAAIAFAAAPEAAFMTGSELVIDGGYTAA